MEENNYQNSGQSMNYSQIGNQTNNFNQQTVTSNSQQNIQMGNMQNSSAQDVSAMYFEKKFMIKYLEEKQELHKVFNKTQFERFVLNHMKSTPDQLLADYIKQYKLILEKYFKQVGVQNINYQIDQVIIGFVKKYNKDFIAYATEEVE